MLLPTLGMEWDGEGDFASLIPDEIWLHLFSFIDDVKTLCRLSEVCKRYPLIFRMTKEIKDIGK